MVEAIKTWLCQQKQKQPLQLNLVFPGYETTFKDKDNHIVHIEDKEMRFATEATETHHFKVERHRSGKKTHRITPGTLQNGNFSARAEIHHDTTTTRNHLGIQNPRSKRTPRKKVPEITGSGFEGRRDAVLQSSSNARYLATRHPPGGLMTAFPREPRHRTSQREEGKARSAPAKRRPRRRIESRKLLEFVDELHISVNRGIAYCSFGVDRNLVPR
ncbi:hypothetical protein C4D60_Mb07t02440 [Musa balbisiana]|uniref:Uncharacterized protein n=1 Tax=Musa balbisiana TaxID=52838 RepID=A0A4S8JCE6_MUSBA|nr:hypothetical protein C4D60_Mb07t02440 [Musa balbisiana]